jgi:hypothetical protein
MPPRKLFASRVRTLERENSHGRLFSLVHPVHPLLADRFSGAAAVSDRLAAHLASAHLRNRRQRRFCAARRTFFPARAYFARPEANLNSHRAGGLTPKLLRGVATC